MKLITGLIGTGTSLMARFFWLMGYDVGEGDIDTYTEKTFEKGSYCGHESWVSARINTKLMVDDDINYEILNKEINSISFPVLKDPRFVYLSKSEKIPNILHWWKIRQDIEIIIMFRDWESQEKQILSKIGNNEISKVPQISKGGWYNKPKNIDYDNILQHRKAIYKIFIDTVNEFKIPYIILKYPDIVDDYDSVQKIVGCPYNRGKAIWNYLADINQCHF